MLKQAQTINQVLSPQMIQALNILQMNSHQLREYINQQLLENPALDIDNDYDSNSYCTDMENIHSRLEWLEEKDFQNIYYTFEDQAMDIPVADYQTYRPEDDLSYYIISQFEGLDLSDDIMNAIRFLIGYLDNRGWFIKDVSQIIKHSKFPEQIMQRALIELQSAEPAGIGACNLKECLRLQIERRKGDQRLAIKIVEHYLEDIAKNRFKKIAKLTKASEKEVIRASILIKALSPHPASGFDSQERSAYIIPDIIIYDKGNMLEFSENSNIVPHLITNSYYLKLLNESKDNETERYLTQKFEQANLLIQNIEQRRLTIQKCVQFILAEQRDFFINKHGQLKPLSMQQAAFCLDMHESTVSRAIRGKYLQCSKGVYPLSFFFVRSVGDELHSSHNIKKLICEYLSKEKTPLSDQKLSDLLAENGCTVSRRTIAKYRAELGIPSANTRKRSKLIFTNYNQ